MCTSVRPGRSVSASAGLEGLFVVLNSRVSAEEVYLLDKNPIEIECSVSFRGHSNVVAGLRAMKKEMQYSIFVLRCRPAGSFSLLAVGIKRLSGRTKSVRVLLRVTPPPNHKRSGPPGYPLRAVIGRGRHNMSWGVLHQPI